MTTTRYVVAPREPTIEMQRANGSSLVEDEVSRAWLDKDARETWAAMLAAAPTENVPVLIDPAELAALRRDAERYRVLQAQRAPFWLAAAKAPIHVAEAMIDAAIDAAKERGE